MKRLLALLLAFLLILPSFAMAADIPDITKDPIGFFMYIFGFPEEWASNPRDVFFYFVIPFLGIWMIILGFLKRIRIFGDSKLYYLLSLAIAISTLPTRIFTFIVSMLFGAMGVWSVGLFVALFFVGTYLLSRGLVRGWREVYGAYDHEIDVQNKLGREVGKQLRDILNELKKAGATGNPPSGKYATMGADERRKAIEELEEDKLDKQKKIAAINAKINYLNDQKKTGKKVWKQIEQT